MDFAKKIDWTNVLVGLLLAILPAVASAYAAVQVLEVKIEAVRTEMLREFDRQERDIRELRQRGHP